MLVVDFFTPFSYVYYHKICKYQTNEFKEFINALGKICQEQPLLLEDLLEQEKREQERQASAAAQQQQQGGQIDGSQTLLSDQDFERLRADVFSSNQQGIPAQGMLPIQQTLQHQQSHQQMQQISGGTSPMVAQQGVRQKFLPRGVVHSQWRPNMSLPLHQQLTGQGNALQSAPLVGTSDSPILVRKDGYV